MVNSEIYPIYGKIIFTKIKVKFLGKSRNFIKNFLQEFFRTRRGKQLLVGRNVYEKRRGIWEEEEHLLEL